METINLGDVHVLKEPHNITSVSKEDFIASQAMLYRKTVIGSVILITTHYLSLTDDDGGPNIEYLSNIYSMYNSITDFKSLVEYIKWLRDNDDLYNKEYDNELKTYTTMSTLGIDDFLTNSINNFLKYILYISNASIDSAYLDIEELYLYLEKMNLINEVSLPLVLYIKDTLAINFKNIDFIRDFIYENKSKIEDSECYLYMIPRLHIHALTHLKKFHLKRIQEYLFRVKSDNNLVTIDHPEYDVLNDLYINSKEFQRHGKIIISYFDNIKANIYSERKSVTVWRNYKNEFIIVK